jgi:predicted Rossmann-fold nucleotide-binding protein
MGAAYWQGLVDWLRERVLPEGMIAERDLLLFTVTDDPVEAVHIVTEADSGMRAEVERAAARRAAEDRLRADASGGEADRRANPLPGS